MVAITLLLFCVHFDVAKFNSSALHNFYPISIWIISKRQSFHAATIRLLHPKTRVRQVLFPTAFFKASLRQTHLLESVSHFSNPIAGLVYIINEESNMAEAFAFVLISSIVLKGIIFLCTMVMGQLKDWIEEILDLCIIGNVGGSHKEQRKIAKVTLLQQFHSHLLVEGQAFFRILDTQHSLGKVALVRNFSVVASFDQLYPISVGVIHKGNPFHAS